jgi:hypothetical protein
MKKRPPGDLATVAVNPLFRWMMGDASEADHADHRIAAQRHAK